MERLSTSPVGLPTEPVRSPTKLADMLAEEMLPRILLSRLIIKRILAQIQFGYDLNLNLEDNSEFSV